MWAPKRWELLPLGLRVSLLMNGQEVIQTVSVALISHHKISTERLNESWRITNSAFNRVRGPVDTTLKLSEERHSGLINTDTRVRVRMWNVRASRVWLMSILRPYWVIGLGRLTYCSTYTGRALKQVCPETGCELRNDQCACRQATGSCQ
jgi:hypothetical protein